MRRCVKDRKGKPAYVEVWNTEEKGSDVNLASHLIIDGHKARYDLAVIISNDSDLKFPVHYVRTEPIRRAALRASQLPPQVPDARGIIHKPQEWQAP